MRPAPRTLSEMLATPLPAWTEHHWVLCRAATPLTIAWPSAAVGRHRLPIRVSHDLRWWVTCGGRARTDLAPAIWHEYADATLRLPRASSRWLAWGYVTACALAELSDAGLPLRALADAAGLPDVPVAAVGYVRAAQWLYGLGGTPHPRPPTTPLALLSLFL